ncbi:MAG: hypothetical protein RMN51_04975 [Verrucomicrobiota bacterium]|nr:hypothetical protein [Limisphaera sp.]MDW8381443.1 hypothetical protein [Verrucomicrobiota bacterium]
MILQVDGGATRSVGAVYNALRLATQPEIRIRVWRQEREHSRTYIMRVPNPRAMR